MAPCKLISYAEDGDEKGVGVELFLDFWFKFINFDTSVADDSHWR